MVRSVTHQMAILAIQVGSPHTEYFIYQIKQASRLLLRLGNVIEQIAGKEELFPAGSTQRGDLLDISEELAKLIETTFSSNKRKK